MKKVTIHDVARRAGVSTATVSNVLNRKNVVSHPTRRKVLVAVEELNYRPSAAARRRLKPSKELSIGLVIKEVHNTYFADIITGVQEAGEEAGYHTVVVSSERSISREHEVVDLLVAKDIDGLIINPLLDDEADLSHLFELRRRNIALVLIESVRGLKASMVDVDNVAASRRAVEHLIGLGHERIVHFAGPRYSAHSSERIEGVRRAFSARDLAFDDQDVIHAGARLVDGYETGLSFFGERREDPPTAVTCYNDLVAIGLMRALRDLGMSVPEDVSIVGYDDIDMAEYAEVPLTTIRVPKRAMGRRAAQMLIQHIEGHGKERIEKECLDAELVVRASTGQVRDRIASAGIKE